MNTRLEIERVRRPATVTTAIVPVFAFALFTSAALLFWVQPLIARMLLPLLGGGPSVWNTCMVFFQAMLLAGYAYALLLSQRLTLRNQAIVHAVLLLGAALVLPIAISNRSLSWLPTESSPILWLLTTLFVTVGPPFLLISATAPLLQRWFSHTSHRSARDPYFLYAISNAGSMLALLAFPLLLEPRLRVRTQNVIWAVGYAVLVVFIIACGVLLNRRRTTKIDTEIESDELVVPVGTSKRLEWILPAFVPSSLMLGVTTYIATDVASVPLIWIVPLALYLLTFIIAFGRKQLLKPWIVSFSLPFMFVLLGAFRIINPPVSVWLTILLHLVFFFIAALMCHQRLAESRPHVSKLPEYYLWIAVGGVLGGAFNALLAPLIFSTALEYPIAIVLACLMRPLTDKERSTDYKVRVIFPVCIFVITFSLSLLVPWFGLSLRYEDGVILLTPLLLCLVLSFQRPILFALGIAAFMLAAMLHLDSLNETLVTERNFFGTWRVTNNSTQDMRRLYHGSTVHGIQLIKKPCVAVSYYSQNGPIGHVFEVYNAKPAKLPVAVTGLGSGTLATYSQPGQQWDFYDIDPSIVRIASDPQLFTYLSNCTQGNYRVILGDARLKLREAPQGHYGVIVLDAFSSDSVPAHMLTSEALELYLSKLAPDGIIAFHISNRYLNLEPLLSGLSRRAGLSALINRDGGAGLPGFYGSLWVVMARDDAALGAIANDEVWEKLQGDVVWTDDFSNILSLLK